MQASQPQQNLEAPLQLLLFVDERPKSRQKVQQIRVYLDKLQADYQFDLEIVDVGEKPYLAEEFKLVATPALIKIHPEPKQVLAGSNIITQLKDWWPKWQDSAAEYVQSLNSLQSVEDSQNGNIESQSISIRSVAASAELIKLSDEVFRLKQEKEKLEEQLQFKDRVIAMLAHDLRNPLTAAVIAIDTLLNNYNSETGAFDRLKPNLTSYLLQQARTQTQNINRMVTDLLQVARGKDAEVWITPEKVDIRPLSEQVLEEMRVRYKAKYHKIQKDIPNDLPKVYADPERIRQVLVNLIDNAIKYTPDGGTITIVALHRTTQKIQFSVGDTGPGIPEENRDRIFENHFRLERDEEKDGYGIGLSLCQRIIRAHYGQIWVSSNSSGGAWFHFTLPVYPK
jgi:two-component system, OmpR family, clock-associated histidine kinase SasA